MGNRAFSATTMTVYEEVLKQVTNPPKYFYPRDITDETGVSRQLTTNLLSRLVGLGLLERDRGRYSCREEQLPILIEYVIGASKNADNPNVRLTVVHSIFNKEDVAAIKTATNVVLKAQSMQMEGYPLLKQRWIDRLEEAQTALKKELKFLKTHNKTTAHIDDEMFSMVIEDLEAHE